MTRDYRSTIYLPTTAFPMKGQLPEREPEILKRWEEIDLNALIEKEGEGRDKFILHDGPPYANGNIHLGHALNKILKDVVNKTQYKLGKATPYVPGWDCHGLPIEAKIEEKHREKGRQKEDIPILQFRQECRAFADHWIDVQRQEFKRLGVTGDWDRPYKTMDYDAEADIIRLLGHFLMNGSLYRGVMPVMWSVVEKTALAEAEIEYEDHESLSIYVRFPVKNAKEPLSAVIWTTTPWTLPGNRAIAYGPDFSYVKLRVEEVKEESLINPGDAFLVAADLRENFEQESGILKSSILETLKGDALEGLMCSHPFSGEGYDFEVPLLPGEHVTLEAGTGLVHTAPGHGVEDFALGKAFDLEVPETVADDGLFYPHVPLFAGKHVYKVGPEIVEKLKEKDALLKEGKILHSYPHSWRSKKPLIYRTTPQWFIDLDKKDLRKKALEAIDTVKWIPLSSKKRIHAMIENRQFWCVSRQRAWGVPLALFVHKESGEVLKDYDVVERIVKAVREKGADVWYSEDPQIFLGDAYKAADYDQIQDIVDVWFDSGATQSFVLRERSELAWPADLYLEGSDQHRGWFQSSLLVSCGTGHDAPYRQVLTHGFIVDEHGRKMSKSRGDAVSPQVVTSTLGADLLRLWVVGTDIQEDLKVGPEILKRQQDLYRRYRNTLRYLLGAVDGFTDAEKLPYEEMPELEKWVLSRLYAIDQKIREEVVSYNFQILFAEIHHFCSVDLSAFYFDIRKDALYCDDPKDPKRRATRTVMDIVFDCLVKWLAPVLCFTAEEAWLQRHPGTSGSVHLELFPGIPFEWNVPRLNEKFEGLRDLRLVMTGALEVARASKVIGSSLQAKLKVYLEASHLPLIQGEDLAELSITSAVSVEEGKCPVTAFTLEDVPGVGVLVEEAEGNKCSRCWKVLPEVGHSTYPDLCNRCSAVLKRIDA